MRRVLLLSLAVVAGMALAGCGTPDRPNGPSSPGTTAGASIPSPAAQPSAVRADDIALVKADHVWRVHTDGSEPVQLTRGAGADFSPAWSPDRAHIAYVHSADPGVLQTSTVCEIPAAGGQAATWTVQAGVLGLCYAPDGKRIALAELHLSGGQKAPFERVTILDRATGKITVAKELHDMFTTGMSLSWSPDGTRLLLGMGRQDAEGQRSGILTLASGKLKWLPTKDAQEARWSPDGTAIVVGQGTQTYTRLSIADTHGVIQLTLVRGGGWGGAKLPVFGGCYSPDGSRIAFSDGSAVWTIGTEGAHKQQVIAKGMQPGWSAR